MCINTRLEKITNRYWKPLLKKGRAIVPAAGWYEWTGEKGNKQPWHIHRQDGAPLYLAALANIAPNADIKTLHAFTIITASADAGLIDVHDRRPLVLTAEDAALWMDPDLPPEQAEQLVRSVALCPEEFAWHMVDKGLGNVRNQGAGIAAPLAP